jgi:hypothetical protein
MVILYVRKIIVFSSGIAQPFDTFCTDVACKCFRISSTGGHEFAPYAAGGGLCLKIWLCETSGTPIYGYFYRENNHEPIRFPGTSIDKAILNEFCASLAGSRTTKPQCSKLAQASGEIKLQIQTIFYQWLCHNQYCIWISCSMDKSR